MARPPLSFPLLSLACVLAGVLASAAWSQPAAPTPSPAPVPAPHSAPPAGRPVKPVPTQPEAGQSIVNLDLPSGRYVEPILTPLVFRFDDVGMIEAERRQYAENLAAFALATVARNHADPDGKLSSVPQDRYDLARKLVGLALHLDPRSRVAVIANGRLKAGVVPQASATPGMAPGTFASLLVGRAAELRKAGGADNLRLAGCFLDLATALDPGSDDAIYAFETFKMDGQKTDWKGILGGE